MGQYTDDEGRCTGVQPAERFPLSDQQQFPDTLSSVRGHRKWEDINLWAPH